MYGLESAGAVPGRTLEKMGWTKGLKAAGLALLLAGAASGVRAAEANPNLSQGSTPTQNPNAFTPSDVLTAPHKSLKLNANGQWGLQLDLDPPVGHEHDIAPHDMSAGAFFHITPAMRIGGSVGLGDRQADPQKILPQDANAPHFHVETKFKF
jgi:hypothetical protein